MKALIIMAINFYQSAVSPYLGHRCRFIPTCSEYMRDAVATDGAARGLKKGLKRLLRCHPWGGFGYDPV